jgi:hypothetical protein
MLQNSSVEQNRKILISQWSQLICNYGFVFNNKEEVIPLTAPPPAAHTAVTLPLRHV